MSGLITQVQGYGLTTAVVLFRLPNSAYLSQEFVYQNYDHCPEFPRMRDLLLHWKQNLDGPLLAVTVWHELLDQPIPILSVDGLKLSIDRFAAMTFVAKSKYN